MKGRELGFLVKVLYAVIDELQRIFNDNDFECEEDRLEAYHFMKNAEVFYTYINTKNAKNKE